MIIAPASKRLYKISVPNKRVSPPILIPDKDLISSPDCLILDSLSQGLLTISCLAEEVLKNN